MSKISVIIPCYNSYKYSTKCLLSLENQIFKDFEVIIIDDDSSDGSYESFCSYKNDSVLNLKLIKHSINQGPGIARKSGIEYASSDWICFCDCDDWYSEDYLMKMYQKAINDNADCVLCDYNKVFYNGKKVRTGYLDEIENKFDKDEIIALAKESLCVIMVKKEIIENLKILPIYHGEDAVLVPQILSYSRNISFVNEPLYNYYMRNDSASNKITRQTYDNTILVFHEIEKFLHESYPTACEFIGIKTILYSAVLDALKGSLNKKLYMNDIKNFENKYPNIYSNQYIKKIGMAKYIFILCVKYRAFFLAKILAKIHTKYIER